MNDWNIENTEELIEYLRRSQWIGKNDRPVCQVLSGGVSNRVVRVNRPGRQAWVLKQALPKLRVAVDWFSDPERIGREALGLRWLRRWLPPGAVPRLIFEDPDHHLLAMEAVPRPHVVWKEKLLAGIVHRATVKEFGERLGLIHMGGWRDRRRTAKVFADRTFFESLRLEPYYLFAARHVSDAAPFLRDLVEECRAHPVTVVHGDYSPKNILLSRGNMVLLDHEVIHFGDPAFDVGFSTTHLLAKALHLPARRPAFLQAAQEHWTMYAATTSQARWRGRSFEARAVRHTLGCLLARAAGRSPLEYLSASERTCQVRTALRFVSETPERMAPFLDAYGAALGDRVRTSESLH